MFVVRHPRREIVAYIAWFPCHLKGWTSVPIIRHTMALYRGRSRKLNSSQLLPYRLGRSRCYGDIGDITKTRFPYHRKCPSSIAHAVTGTRPRHLRLHRNQIELCPVSLSHSTAINNLKSHMQAFLHQEVIGSCTND